MCPALNPAAGLIVLAQNLPSQMIGQGGLANAFCAMQQPGMMGTTGIKTLFKMGFGLIMANYRLGKTWMPSDFSGIIAGFSHSVCSRCGPPLHQLSLRHQSNDNAWVVVRLMR